MQLNTCFPFWDQLNPGEKELLRGSIRAVHFDKGHTLHRGDNECLGVIYIKSGSLRIYLTSDEGREITLYRLEAGDTCILSATCVLQSIDFDVSIDAEQDCELLQISSAAFSRLSSQNVYVELFSYKLAAERFSDVMWAMQQILFTSFDKRLAAFLLEEASRLGTDKISMTHEQIARYLGTAREVVSRMLKYFEQEGCVSLSRGGLTILDKKALGKMT